VTDLGRRLRSLRVPDEDGATERAWGVVRAAFQEREPVSWPRRHTRPLLAAAAGLAVVAAAVTPPGRAVVGSLRDAIGREKVVGVRRAEPAGEDEDAYEPEDPRPAFAQRERRKAAEEDAPAADFLGRRRGGLGGDLAHGGRRADWIAGDDEDAIFDPVAEEGVAVRAEQVVLVPAELEVGERVASVRPDEPGSERADLGIGKRAWRGERVPMTPAARRLRARRQSLRAPTDRRASP